MALNLTVKVHPVVLFQIVDAYERRNADSHRVIGTLLGTAEKGVVEVTNCFCVPHKEYDDQVEAELNYAMDLYDLNHRVNAQENIVGWWATGTEVTTHSSVIHEYYARECNNPVHLTLDTTLADSTRMGIKAYVCVQLGVPNGKQGCMFTPTKVQITCYEPEVVGLQLCAKTQLQPQVPVTGVGKPGGGVEPMMDLAQIAEASSKLTSMLDQVLAYVDNVLSGKQPPDNQVGRALLDMVHSVPKMTSEQFDEMFNSNVKDLLMVVALSQLIKTQLQLNEKLTLLTTL
ncbi:eukaryotic translation initiation factor 3 subunit F [Orussus abietinus]|uniref:eukaryotic translation initiation factor 3 subunit F n=1 Tax=Orussus abietinus TaxID=222816 RepID=UPI000626D547|nr:eukaryotic translation initiation factor 3 subunit F [Orussus abietinus]XP_012273079.1 eukaryotic translation initiation factor 3 subunit F [Orussus abietinus]